MTIHARVYRSSKRVFECLPEGGGPLVQATAMAQQLKHDHVVVGDKVVLEKTPSGEWFIQEVSPRQSFVFRNIPRERVRKVVAANVDAVLIVVSAAMPSYKRGLVDRYLVRARQWGLPALLVFNKMDLFDESFDLQFESNRVVPAEVTSFEVSADDPSRAPKFLPNGFAELQKILSGNTAILLGQSGVGKSRLITQLSGGMSHLLSGDLGKIGKGMHTTTWAELVDCGSFTLVDSPGVRSMSLEDISEDDLLSYFPDVAEGSVKCKFSNCTHTNGVKGCWFQSLDPEKYDDALILSRMDSYQRILGEVQGIPDWEKDV